VQKFAADVVEAAENLRRGIDALPPPTEGEPDILAKVRDGLGGIERSFAGILERNGVKKSDPVGQPFDPNLHQAMQEVETADHPPGTVAQAWTAAWTLNGRLLKPAMVVVAKQRQSSGLGRPRDPAEPSLVRLRDNRHAKPFRIYLTSLISPARQLLSKNVGSGL